MLETCTYHDRIDTFLKLNDQINTVLGRYDAWKKGDYEAAKNPIPNELSNSNAGVSLIDFDDSSPSTSGAQGGTQTSLNDLESLFGPSSSAPPPHQPSNPQSQGISAFSMGAQYQTPTSTFPPSLGFSANSAMMSGTGGSPAMGTPSSSTASSPYHIGSSTPSGPSGMIRLGTPQLQAQNTGPRVASPAPNYFAGAAPATSSMGTGLGISSANGASAFGGMGMGGGQMNMMTPQQQQQQQQRPQQSQSPPQPTNTAGQAQGKDPFADLVGLF